MVTARITLPPIKGKKVTKKEFDVRLDKLFGRTLANVQINVMDLGKIMDAGRKVIADGGDDEAVANALRNAATSCGCMVP